MRGASRRWGAVRVACPVCGAAAFESCVNEPTHRGFYHSARWHAYERLYPTSGGGKREVTMKTFFRRVKPKYDLPSQLKPTRSRIEGRLSAACDAAKHWNCYALACICTCHPRTKEISR